MHPVALTVEQDGVALLLNLHHWVFNNGNDYVLSFTLRATETHALAAANQQKNDRLRAAFGISKDYVDGSSFHPECKEREKEKREQEKLEREKQLQQKYT